MQILLLHAYVRNTWNKKMAAGFLAIYPFLEGSAGPDQGIR